MRTTTEIRADHNSPVNAGKKYVLVSRDEAQHLLDIADAVRSGDRGKIMMAHFAALQDGLFGEVGAPSIGTFDDPPQSRDIFPEQGAKL